MAVVEMWSSCSCSGPFSFMGRNQRDVVSWTSTVEEPASEASPPGDPDSRLEFKGEGRGRCGDLLAELHSSPWRPEGRGSSSAGRLDSVGSISGVELHLLINSPQTGASDDKHLLS